MPISSAEGETSTTEMKLYMEGTQFSLWRSERNGLTRAMIDKKTVTFETKFFIGLKRRDLSQAIVALGTVAVDLTKHQLLFRGARVSHRFAAVVGLRSARIADLRQQASLIAGHGHQAVVGQRCSIVVVGVQLFGAFLLGLGWFLAFGNGLVVFAAFLRAIRIVERRRTVCRTNGGLLGHGVLVQQLGEATATVRRIDTSVGDDLQTALVEC